jgi:hypothetical protein
VQHIAHCLRASATHAAAQRSGSISALTAPPDIAAHALRTVRHIACLDIQRLARLTNRSGA